MKKDGRKIDRKIIEEVEQEFPGDVALQQIHIARRLISQEAQKIGMGLHEYVRSRSASSRDRTKHFSPQKS